MLLVVLRLQPLQSGPSIYNFTKTRLWPDMSVFCIMLLYGSYCATLIWLTLVIFKCAYKQT